MSASQVSRSGSANLGAANVGTIMINERAAKANTNVSFLMIFPLSFLLGRIQFVFYVFLLCGSKFYCHNAFGSCVMFEEKSKQGIQLPTAYRNVY